MRLLANENFPRQAVEALRAAGHDVAWVVEGTPSVEDRSVLQQAVAEERVLVTLDKDFGELDDSSVLGPVRGNSKSHRQAGEEQRASAAAQRAHLTAP
ncbi:MAG: DUF5615 family PIN-like protein [Deltaproteobacteria bacterium]|nr:DUF5615 family PIN-like protein [Deltaproteobacteria bacterium]